MKFMTRKREHIDILLFDIYRQMADRLHALMAETGRGNAES